MRATTPLAAAVLAFGLFSLAPAAPQLDTFSPRSGPPGTVVTVTGSGFGTDAGELELKVGSSVIAVQSVTDSTITFSTTASTPSGPVTITRAGASVVSAAMFLHTRTITGVLQPPAGIDVTGYRVGRGVAAVEVAAQGAFAGTTLRDAPEIFTAWREVDDPMFLAVAWPTSDELTINARSTAIALVFCSPLVSLHDGALTNDLRARLGTWEETALVAAAISAASAEGRPYLDDERFSVAFEALLRKAVEPAGVSRAFAHPEVQPALGPEVRAFSILKNEITPVRLQPTARTLPDKPDSWAFEMAKSETHPNLLHEGLVFLRLAPSSFPSGIHSIENLDSSAAVTQSGGAPISRGFLSSSLRSEALDLANQFGKLMTAALDWAGGTNQQVSTSGFVVPKHESAIYEVRAFSGNLAYGTTGILGPNVDQTIALANLDRDDEWSDALYTNLAIAAIDFASILLGEVKALSESDLAGLILNVKVEVSKAVAAHIAARGDLDSAALWDIVKAAAVGVAKSVGPSASSAAADRLLFSRFLHGLQKVAKKVFAITTKVSVGLQIIERAGNLVLPTHFALERTIIVVGDPFAPAIDTFSPTFGRAGATMYITGRGLPASPANLQVSLCTFSATGNPPTIGASLPLTIQGGNAQALSVKLPEASAFTAAFGPGSHELYLCIENVAAGSKQTTRLNREPYRTFRYRGPPEIVSVSPDPLFPGAMFRVKASGLSGVRDLDITASVQSTTMWSQAITGGELSFTLAANAQTGTWPLTLTVRDPETLQVVHTSAPVNVTIEDPWPATVGQNAPERGLSIRISQWDMSNVADGHISLYEAFAIAAGTLGRSIEMHPTPEDSALREEDWIDGLDERSGGADVRDSITAANNTGAETPIVLAAPLPRLGHGDFVFFNRILDGSALPEGTVGLDLVGLEGVDVSGMTFQNFPGHGIHLGAGSLLNRVGSVIVRGCGGTGVRLETGASFNDFFALTIEDAGLDGIHLSGATTQGNLFASASAPPLSGGEIGAMRIRRAADVGLRIEGGAADNGVDVFELRDCGSHGIEITGEGTVRNRVGWVAGLQGIRPVAGNGGDGIRIGPGAAGTSTWYLMCAGNTGHGYHVFGPGTDDVVLRGVWTGVDHGPADKLIARRNGGHSIVLRGVRRCAIGAPDRSGLGDDTCVGGSDLGGILLDDADDCTLRGLQVGIFNNLFGAIEGDTWLPVGAGHAIHLMNGSSGNRLGDALTAEGLLVRAAPGGSGLLLEGEGTDDNIVLGSTFGALSGAAGVNLTEELAYGISLLDGASNNVIGGPGAQVALGFNQFLRASNRFNYASVAGVRIENVAAELDAAGEPINPNRIVANSFGVTGFGAASLQPYVGILLKGATRGQWIGGPVQEAGNQLGRVGFAGIHLDDVTASSFAERNRFGGNWISVAFNPAATNTDPVAGPLRSHALLITGGANQVVGENFAANNQFFGGDAGVFINGGSGHHVRAARVDNHPVAGVVIRDATDCIIGGDRPDDRLQLTRNGGGTEPHRAAVLIVRGSGHRVSACWIGDEGGGDPFWANPGDGVRIVDSPRNVIGGAHPLQANIITRCGRDGVHIRGVESVNNLVGRNIIGLDTRRNAGGNAGHGVRFAAGASINTVGGVRLQGLARNPIAIPAPNVITGSGGDGVLVEGGGPETASNRILGNSIYSNTGLGIFLALAGNHGQPAPRDMVLSATEVSGTVASLATTPAGSRVEVFADHDLASPEGEIFLGWTTVDTEGNWSMPRPFIPAGGILTATVTHAVTGDTSPFATATEFRSTFGFRVDVTPGAAPAADIWPGGAEVPVLGVTVSSDNVDVVVAGLLVELGGTAELSSLRLRVVHDTNNDGVADPGDRELGAETTPGAAEVELSLEAASLAPDERQRWLVLARAVNGAPTGRTLNLRLGDSTDVPTRLVLPVGVPITALGAFPLESNAFTIGAGSAPPVLITTHPQAATIVAGSGLVLTVGAQGDGLSYQWLLNGIPVPGATGATLTIPVAQRFHAGDYSVVVTNAQGSQTSSAATVAVDPAAPSAARLVNLSTRGLAQAGENILIPGFVVQGSAPKRVLIRAVGPTLGLPPLGVDGVAPDPQLLLKRYNPATSAYDDYTSNDNWLDNANAVEIADVAAEVFAFALQDENEAALLLDLPPGQYTAHAGDKHGASGIALVELYDVDGEGSGSRLVNISNRGFVGVGAQVMIPGFVVSDEGPKKLLIRVVGPSLGQFGVNGTMADPALALYKRDTSNGSEELLLTNNDWQAGLGGGETMQVAQAVFAFALHEGSTDAAVVVTLPPGVYTVLGASADGIGTGVVLVEVYAVP